MNPFRTVLSPCVSTHTIGLADRIMTIGSCFADAIASRLGRHKWAALQNPFGVIYNPVSIHKVLEYALRDEKPPEHTYLTNQDVHLNYDFHSSISAMSRDELKKTIEGRVRNAHAFLQEATVIIITYGTAWVYKRKDNDDIVANCHKIPAAQFEKYLLTQKKMLESFDACYKVLKQVKPSVRIVLTVSPVRHVKDTLELNSVSKAILRVACHTLSELYDDVDYFPAYEIMMDDLRDYRFYKSDMIHPTEEAEDYIWNTFINTYADNNARHFIEQWQKILQSLSHKPFHSESTSHQRFLQDLLNQITALQGVVNVEKELDMVRSQLRHRI